MIVPINMRNIRNTTNVFLRPERITIAGWQSSQQANFSLRATSSESDSWKSQKFRWQPFNQNSWNVHLLIAALWQPSYPQGSFFIDILSEARGWYETFLPFSPTSAMSIFSSHKRGSNPRSEGALVIVYMLGFGSFSSKSSSSSSCTGCTMLSPQLWH